MIVRPFAFMVVPGETRGFFPFDQLRVRMTNFFSHTIKHDYDLDALIDVADEGCGLLAPLFIVGCGGFGGDGFVEGLTFFF